MEYTAFTRTTTAFRFANERLTLSYCCLRRNATHLTDSAGSERLTILTSVLRDEFFTTLQLSRHG
jgi:hypothetical protein